jgi:hypothetical protein
VEERYKENIGERERRGRESGGEQRKKGKRQREI